MCPVRVFHLSPGPSPAILCPESLPAALLAPVAMDIYEGHAGFLGEFLTAQDLLEQGLLEGLSCVTPQPVLTTGLGHHDTAQRVFGWGPVRHGDGQYLSHHRKLGREPLPNLLFLLCFPMYMYATSSRSLCPAPRHPQAELGTPNHSIYPAQPLIPRVEDLLGGTYTTQRKKG